MAAGNILGSPVEGQFKQLEKRIAAFKFVFGRLQTTYGKGVNLESFPTSHAIYLDDLVNGTILVANDGEGDATILPTRTRAWTKGSHTGTPLDTGTNSSDDLWAGSFTVTDNASTANPNVEKIIIPLIKLDQTNNQTYVAYEFQGDEIDDNLIIADGAVTTEVDDTYRAYGLAFDNASMIDKDSRRLKRFIDPVRFGSDYTATIQTSNTDRTGGQITIAATAALPAASLPDQARGGWVFDYNSGILSFAAPTDDEYPYLPQLKHPLWLTAYRYIGPTGSNMSVTSAGTSGTSTSGGGGVSTTLTSLPSTVPGTYDTNAFGWYDDHTFSATDSEDIIEYISGDAIIVSASFGDRDLVVRLDSSSYDDITTDTWPSYDENNGANYNGANLFEFSSETTPNYASYGLFTKTVTTAEPESSAWITQSFEFGSAIRLSQIGLCYSNNDNSAANLIPDNENYGGPETTHFPAAFKLEGSVDAINYSLIASASGIRSQSLIGQIHGPILNTISAEEREFGTSFGSSDNSQYWTDSLGEATVDPIRIYCATASIATASRYQYYRLYVSGGLVTPAEEDSTILHETAVALHHVDLWQNLDFGPTNRKQLTVKLNDTLSSQTAFEGGGFLTQFEVFLSQSAAKLGLVTMSDADLTVFKGGAIGQTLIGTPPDTDPNLELHLQNFTQITGSIISASNSIITGELTATTLSGHASEITFTNITASGDISASGTITARSIAIDEGITDIFSNADFIIPSGKKIFLTNVKQDGSPGTDEFSARIFGNYNTAGVSDMYLDAYRIYNVADAKVDIRTLHPTLGRIVLQSPQTHISGSLSISQSLYASSITSSHGMTLSGSILISGSIIPNVGADTLTSSFDLGSSTAAWHDIHVSDGTIRFYNGNSEKINMSIDDDSRVQFKSGSEFQTVRTGKIELVPSGSTISNVQLSDQTDVGFIAVMSEAGQHATILRAENQSLGPLLGRDYVAGTLTQKGSGSFAILLDADDTNHNLAKFSVESNSAVAGFATRLFSVSESGETRAYGHLKVDNYINATSITASSFIGTFVGALSSSAQIATNISGAFSNISSSFDGRLTTVETELNNTLISGSSQLATEISGAFTNTSESLSSRIGIIESELTNTLISGSDQIATEISGAFTNVSESLSSRISIIDLNQSTLTTTSSFNSLSASVQLKSDISFVQSIIDITGSLAVTSSNVTFNNITSSNINTSGIVSASSIETNIISASNFHTTIFNPTLIDTTTLSASISNLGTISNTRTTTTDHFNNLFAANARPVLTIKNTGGSDITYFGSPVNNADAFIKFEADRSNSNYAVGIDSHDGDFKITSGSTLNANSAGSTGYPTFRIQDNKVGIVKGSTVSYTLDVGGDIRSTGTVRTDTIKGQTYPYTSIVLESNVTTSLNISSSGTITANSFVGDGTALSGIATIGNVVLNSATASFLTDASVIDGGSF